jgi:hypothetical protein
VAACLAVSGCAGGLDTLTSHKYRKNLWEHPYATLFVTPDAMEVLRTSEDGEDRAAAMRRLKEPKQHGGTDAQQDEVMQILTQSATADPRPVCRLAAISALGTFRDPRAAPVLSAAYYTVTNNAAPAGKVVTAKQPFSQEVVTVIRCRALTALGQTGQQSGLEALTKAATDPVPETASETDKQEARDVRVAAVRALSAYPASVPAATALVQVLRTERPGPLRNRANDALVTITGKDLPPDPDQWQAVLDASGGTLPMPNPGVIQQVGAWFKP